jgi:AcrR family transcriptional regulator
MAAEQTAEQGTQTRDRILATAASLFSENGYEQTPLSQIARAAGVSKALILWHFANKEELVRAALGRALEPYYIDVADLAGLDAAQRIERLIDQFYEFVRDNLRSVRFLIGLLVRSEREHDAVKEHIGELYSVFRRLLSEAIETGRDTCQFRADVEPDLDAALVLASLAGILVENFLRDADLRHGVPPLLEHLKRTVLSRLLMTPQRPPE